MSTTVTDENSPSSSHEKFVGPLRRHKFGKILKLLPQNQRNRRLAIGVFLFPRTSTQLKGTCRLSNERQTLHTKERLQMLDKRLN